MSCNNFEPTGEEMDALVTVEMVNFDFAGKEMVLVSGQTTKEAYVIGVKCFVDTYWVEIDSDWSTGELMKENVLIGSDGQIVNVDREFDIITVNDFNEMHPAGSSVRDCFLKTYLKDGRAALDMTYMLILREMPLAGTHSFKIVYKLKPAEVQTAEGAESVIESVTKPIELH